MYIKLELVQAIGNAPRVGTSVMMYITTDSITPLTTSASAQNKHELFMLPFLCLKFLRYPNIGYYGFINPLTELDFKPY